jgi:hypothetical protein
MPGKNLNMSYFRKKLERRTFSQDRYYILIKRQKEGKATFNELTELDEIVNRVPDIRDIVIRENFGEVINETDESSNDQANGNKLHPQPLSHQSLWAKIKLFLSRVFFAQISLPVSTSLQA